MLLNRQTGEQSSATVRTDSERFSETGYERIHTKIFNMVGEHVYRITLAMDERDTADKEVRLSKKSCYLITVGMTAESIELDDLCLERILFPHEPDCRRVATLCFMFFRQFDDTSAKSIFCLVTHKEDGVFLVVDLMT